MKLAIVSRYPPPAEGISDYGRHVATSLSRSPEVEQLTIIANTTSAFGRGERVPRDLRRVWATNAPTAVARILQEVDRLRPDAVWYNAGLTMFGDRPPALLGFLLPALTRRLGMRSIVTLHEQPIDQLRRVGAPDDLPRRVGLRLATRLLLESDVVCVTTQRHLRTLRGRRDRGLADLVHLPLCGYGEPSLDPLPAVPTALILTSHAPHKNLPMLLDAFGRVHRRLPAARLLVAGIDHPRFPGYLARLRCAYADLSGVDWIGEISDEAVSATIRRARVVVAPYRVATGSSASVHQAVSLGRPVIVADLPEFRTMAEEEDLWLEFFPPDDPTALEAALECLLRDPVQCREMAAYNHASARRNSLAATTARYLQLFRPPEPALYPAISTSYSPGRWR